MKEIPLSEYPRPQLRRESYLCLNGLWDYAIRDVEEIPSTFDRKILVPYSPETKISGVDKSVGPNDWLFYHLKLNLPEEILNDKVILHFGAVDQIAEVFVNGQIVTKHIGGFLPFEVDIKPYLKKENHLVVRVKDYSDTSYYSRGKQKIKRGGIWYTAQSGIYMPVWVEGVSNDYIESIKLEPNIDKSEIKISVKSSSICCKLLLNQKEIILDTNKDSIIKIDDPILWTPENPYLYKFQIETEHDRVDSYFAMRKFSRAKDENGYERLCLNNKPIFMKGVLDQGYYHDGFLTPNSDQDYIDDINLIKSLGFNVSRKHIKIESLRWYYHCDRLGLIVWQDFVNGGSAYNSLHITAPLITHIHLKGSYPSLTGRKSKQGKLEALDEFKQTINLLYNCPCIALWTVFNEGWGQFDTKEVMAEVEHLDRTRLFDHASGWHDQGISDVKSLHVYFSRFSLPPRKTYKNRALILSECGGYKLSIKDHVFSNKEFGYKDMSSKEKFLAEYKEFIEKDILRFIPKGLSAFIYTQLSDVEDELNGFVTYDRQVTKINPKQIKELNQKATL